MIKRIHRSEIFGQGKETPVIELTVQTQLLARVLKDPAFRQALLEDPKAVLANEYKIQLSEHITVRVLEEARNTLIIVLPARTESVLELADSDLEACAGGIRTAGARTDYPNSIVMR